MNRKQFLKNVGIGAIAFTSVTAALKAFGRTTFTGQESGRSVLAKQLRQPCHTVVHPMVVGRFRPAELLQPE